MHSNQDQKSFMQKMRRESLRYTALEDSSNKMEKVPVDQTQAPAETAAAPSSSSVWRDSTHATENTITESDSFDAPGSSAIPSSFLFNSFPASLPRIHSQTFRAPSVINTTPFIQRGHDVSRGIFSVMEEMEDEDKRPDSLQQDALLEGTSTSLHPNESPAHDSSRNTTSSRKSTIYRRRPRRWHAHYNLRPSTSSSSSSTCSSTNSNCNTSSNWLSPLARRNEGFEDNTMQFAIGVPNMLSSTQVLKEADVDEDAELSSSQSPWKIPPVMHTKLFHNVLGRNPEDIPNNQNDGSGHTTSSEYPWLPQSKVLGAFTPFRGKNPLHDPVNSRGHVLGSLNGQDDSNNVEGLSPISPYKPLTPTDKNDTDARFKLQFETQYSPIPTISDDPVSHSLAEGGATNNMTSMAAFDVHGDMDIHDPVQHHLFPHHPRSFREEVMFSHQHHLDVDMQNDDLVNKSLDTSFMSHQSDASSTSTSRQRKNRPMPDMSAFDMGLSEITTSTSIQSGEMIHNHTLVMTDGAPDLGERRRQHSLGSNSSRLNHMVGSTKWICPPTPARTPAWAQGDGTSTLHRADSLITTKLLATCPQHILDGLSSLENSFMDEGEHNKSTSGSMGSDLPQHTGSVHSNRDKSLVVSFATVMEENEADLSSTSLEMQVGSSIRQGDGIVSSDTKSNNEDRSFILAKRRHSSPLDLPSHEDSPNIRNVYTHNHKIVKSEKRPAEDYSQGDDRTRYHTSSSLSSEPNPTGSTISFHNDFEVLAQLGSGSFADVFKARFLTDGHIYAIKRSRRRFRGKRDRDRNLAEVRIMQQLQTIHPKSDGRTRNTNLCVYLLFFIRAWQEDAHFFCQTELCCRDSCRHLLLSLTTDWDVSSVAYPSLIENLQLNNAGDNFISNTARGHLIPEQTLWKICHDISAGLTYIHSHHIVHLDIKPDNIFFISHLRLGAICKIGDFGLARAVDSMDEGEEGDTAYMASELLVPSDLKHPKSCDIFSLGLTLYELSSSSNFDLPLEGPRWHELRSGHHVPILPLSRSPELKDMIQSMISASQNRPSAENILGQDKVTTAGNWYDKFLRDYIHDIEVADHEKEKHISQMELESRYTPTHFVRRTSGVSDSDTRTPTPR